MRMPGSTTNGSPVCVVEDDAQLTAVAESTSPGVFTIVIPCFAARPERG